jgi:hypothetical protein
MKNRLLQLAAGLALMVVLGKIYAVPLLAQVRAALVKNTDEPGRLPFTSLVAGNSGGYCSFNCTADQGTNSFALLPAVPSGKRLIVNHVFGGEAFASLRSIGLGSTPNGIDFQADKLFFTGPFTSLSPFFYFDAQPFLTFEPGTNVWVKINFAGNCDNCNGYIRVSGYLIDANN